MKRYLFILISTCLFANLALAQDDLNLWYKKPAANWNEALPIGNGRLGAMVFGRVTSELIQLNEESLWSGSVINDNNPQSKAHLAEIQQLILDGKNNEAHDLMSKYMIATPKNFGSYQTLGNLQLQFADQIDVKNYKRKLDLATGITSVNYTANNVNYSREIFVSAPANAIIIKLKGDRPNSLNFKANIYRELDAGATALDNKTVILNGQVIDLNSEDTGPGGLNTKFNAIVKVLASDGTTTASNNGILVQNASDVTILVTAATDYNLAKLNFDRNINPKAICENIISKVENVPYDKLLATHVADFKPIMDRVSLNLGGEDLSALPTDERMAKVRKGEIDKQLMGIYFQYGRYLLLNSSRKPGILPANLQGIWNEFYNAPWQSDYHTNINLQMNYWPADIANIQETVMPYVDFVDAYRTPGRVAAQEMYGAKGWTMHHSTNIFGRTGLIAGVHWGTSPLAAAWLCLNVWEHYRFTEDKKFLSEKAYPIMKEAAVFIQDFLIKDKNGYLVTAPSMSPENAFKLPNGKKDQITYAPTIDVMLIMELYNACIEAGTMLKDDPKFIASLRSTLKQLPPIKISPKTGAVQEWIEDYEQFDPGHRHISHLLGLYPANLIKPSDTKLFEAAKKTLELRLKNGGGHTGWSRAWIINFYARLLDGEKAGENVQMLLQKSTLDNLFDNHPPFQIDGNFGGTAGIIEMLLQSHNGYIELLPALPKNWDKGNIKGILARGGFEIAMAWDEGVLKKASLISKNGNTVNLKYGAKMVKLKTKPGQSIDLGKLLNL